ncbi:MAG: hypothetical protein PHG19_04820 [Anaerotignum sp.]|nr:hypothetical protein [Anaerotignum sp.]
MNLRYGLSNKIENTSKRKDDNNEAMLYLKEFENVLEIYKKFIQEYYNKSNSYDMKCFDKIEEVQTLIKKNTNDMKDITSVTIETKGILGNLDKTIESSGNQAEILGKIAEEKTEEIGEKIINNINELVSDQLKQMNLQMNAQLTSITNEFGTIKKVIKKQMLLSFLLFFIIAAGLCVLTILVLYFMGYIYF